MEITNIPCFVLFVCFASEVMAGKERVKGRGLIGAADPCNTAMGKIKKEGKYIGLAMELYSEVEFLQVEKTVRKVKQMSIFR